MARIERQLEVEHGGRRFVIGHDGPAGWYLYVYEGSECVRDHLQDSLDIAIEQAASDYGVNPDDWRA